MVNRLYLLALAGGAVAASAYVIRQSSHRREKQRHKDDLSTWEGEGGKPATAVTRPDPASTPPQSIES